MTHPSLIEWMAGRTPPVPPAFLAHLTPRETEVPSTTPESLVNEAREALVRALALEPSDRRGAFELLSADAWATWAAEAALDSADPEAELLEQIDVLTRGTRSDE